MAWDWGELVRYFSCPEDSQLKTARQMWWGGFLGLPLLWLLNWLNFRTAAEAPEASSELKNLVRMSGAGSLIAGAVMVLWLVYFQYHVDDAVCPCDGPFGSEMRCHCALGDKRVYPESTSCVSPQGSCPGAEGRAQQGSLLEQVGSLALSK
mmetsp:Transcript_61720/g.151935  ORF Transcript_61720/g.151935 Transcript_61720/m.151935 type:complete len:151 (-) Transcript_61720:96-548(-)